MDGDMMMEVVGAIRFNESDLKYDEAVEKIINQLGEKMFDEFYDAISGEVLDKEVEQQHDTSRDGKLRCTRRLRWRSAGKWPGGPKLE